MTNTNVPICTGMPKPKIRGGRRCDRAGADEGAAEVRHRDFDHGGDERHRQPRNRPDLRRPVRKQAGDHRPLKSGRPPGRPGHGIPTRINTVVRPKQINSRVRFAVDVDALRASTRPTCAMAIAGIIDGGVLDGPEPQRRILHRAAEVVQNRLHVGADDEIEQDAEEQLEVEHHHRDQAPAIGEGTRSRRSCRARRRASCRRRQPGQSSEARNAASGRSYTCGHLSTTQELQFAVAEFRFQILRDALTPARAWRAARRSSWVRSQDSRAARAGRLRARHLRRRFFDVGLVFPARSPPRARFLRRRVRPLCGAGRTLSWRLSSVVRRRAGAASSFRGPSSEF